MADNRTFTVLASEDDRDSEGFPGVWNPIDNTLLRWRIVGPIRNAFVRWQIDIPKGARILTETLILTDRTGAAPNTRLVDLDDCPAFDTFATPEDVPLTVPTGFLQEFIDRPGYVPGNYMGYRFPAVNNGTCKSFDGGGPPQLYIEWEFPLSVKAAPQILGAGAKPSIVFSPSPDGDGQASPQIANFFLSYNEATIVTVTAPATNPSGYIWKFWDFGGGDEREGKTQEHEATDKTPDIIIATYEVAIPGQGPATTEGLAGKPVWVYTLGEDNVHEQSIFDDSVDSVILNETVSNLSAWIQPGGRRYVAFDRDGDCKYIYYDGTWSSPVLIRADRTDPAAIPLPQSRDVMIICKDSSDNFYLNFLRWNGSSYDVESEIDMGVNGNQTGDGWPQAGGRIFLAYTDVADDLQTISTDLSGETWT